MIELARVAIEVDAPAAALWEVLVDFGHPQRLAASIEECTVTASGAGAVRKVVSSRGLVIFERLVEADEAAGRFVYEVLDTGDMPFAGVTAYRATVTLAAQSPGRTLVTWLAGGVVDGPVAPVTAFLEGLYAQAIRNLAAAATSESPAA